MDPSTFQRLIDAWYDPLYRFALSLSRNADDALDLTRQTFARWAEKGSTLRDGDKAKSWLFMVLYGEFLDSRRLRQRKVPGETDGVLDVELAGANSAVIKIDSRAAIVALWELEGIFRVPITMNQNLTARLGQYLVAALLATLLLGLSSVARAATPQVGDAAPNFSLRTLDDKAVELKSLTATRPLVLVVLRGWYGAQCPICSRQVNDFVTKAADFAAKGVQVVMVYPGPSEQLKARAQEFLANKDWPKEFLYVLDPDYTFTKAYGLRWDAPREAAYPSTFIIDRDGRVRFAHVSKTHGNRVSAAAALEALPKAR